jgi:hypothetical protein
MFICVSVRERGKERGIPPLTALTLLTTDIDQLRRFLRRSSREIATNRTTAQSGKCHQISEKRLGYSDGCHFSYPIHSTAVKPSAAIIANTQRSAGCISTHESTSFTRGRENRDGESTMRAA